MQGLWCTVGVQKPQEEPQEDMHEGDREGQCLLYDESDQILMNLSCLGSIKALY